MARHPMRDCRRVASGCFVAALCLFAAGYITAGSDDLLVVVENGKYGFIDHEGKVLIKPQYIWAEDFWRGLGTVYICGRYVSIDRSGTLHPLRLALEGKLETRSKGAKAGFVDASGEFKIAPTFEEVLPFSEGLAAVRPGATWGFVDESGTFVIPPQFEAAYYFHDGVATAEDRSGAVLIDRMGKVLARGYHFTDLVWEGRVPVDRDGRAGFLDVKGNVVIPLEYDSVTKFSDGLAAVRKGERWGYVDRDGKLVIPVKFDRAGFFSSGFAPAAIEGRTGFIDKSGKVAFYLDYEYAPGFLTGDRDSNLLIAPSDVSRFFTRDEQFGYVTTSGKVIWGPVKDIPDHPPLLGWSEQDNVESCRSFPESTKRLVAGFPKR